MREIDLRENKMVFQDHTVGFKMRPDLLIHGFIILWANI